MKKWEKVIKDIEDGKSYTETVKDIPLAVKLIKKRFSQNHISIKQRAAIKRG